MRVPLSWLAEYVTLTLPPEELARRLTMAGVESYYDPGASGGWDKVVVGHVLEVNPHPNADRLRLATVDIGAGDPPTVVCGAPNLATGQKIAFAQVGARLVNGHTGEPLELTPAKIRGVVSAGMCCSGMELGLSGDHDGIIVLPDDAPIGTPLADYLPDGALEIEITANRGDCLSVLGVAHEIAAFTHQTVREPSVDYNETGPLIDEDVTVRVDDPELCYRYTASAVHGIRIGPSPDWLKRRLEIAGQRSINNVVDVTNYVMLEYGQPLHAFDLAKVEDATIVVRPATPGERFVTLDGEEHEMKPPMLLIADPEKGIGVAGVMGGLNSEMTDDTTDLLLESATFNAINTRRTATALKMRTEASTRFEKGLNVEMAEKALRRATKLVLETAGGIADVGISDTMSETIERPKILFTQYHLRRVLGTSFAQKEVIRVLRALGFEVGAIDENKLLVSPPYWRTDVNIEEDVIEEVARTIGYDEVPSIALAGAIPSTIEQQERAVREEVRDLLVSSGMQETISYSLVSRSLLEQVNAAGDGLPEPLRAVNPMSREQEYLRTSLRGTILRNASAALRQPPGIARLFEIGRTFTPRPNDLPDEQEMAVGVLAGGRGVSLWQTGDGAIDFYDAKGAVETVLDRLGVDYSFERGEDPLLHPGRTARVIVNGKDAGVVGELHPRTIASFDFSVETVAMFELDIEKIAIEVQWLRHQFRPFSRYPSAERDLAFLVDSAVSAEAIASLLESNDLVVQATLFDLFEGLAEDRKSLAYRLVLQSPEGTLTAEQVNAAVGDIVSRVERETGATLRS